MDYFNTVIIAPELDNYNKVLEILRNAIKDDDNQLKARKRFEVERWIRINKWLIRHFNKEELKFFFDIFSDDSCWDGIKLKNNVVGKRLVEKKNQNGEKNPLCIFERYLLACKYCVEDKILELCEEVFKQFKKDVSINGRSDDDLEKELMNALKKNAIQNFWFWHIDLRSKKLCYKPEEDIDEALDVNSYENWAEGIEFFYNKLQNDPSIPDRSDLLIEAVLIKTDCIDTVEFCLSKMSNDIKKKLLQKDLEKNKHYAVLHELINQYCFHSFKNLFDLLEPKDLTFQEYGFILETLSSRLLQNSDLAEQVREVIMYVWRHTNFYDCRKRIFLHCSCTFTSVVANLIASVGKENLDHDKKEEEILKIEEIFKTLKHLNHPRVINVRRSLVHRMCRLHGKSIEQFPRNLSIIRQLFSKLRKSSECKKEYAVQSSESATEADLLQ